MRGSPPVAWTYLLQGHCVVEWCTVGVPGSLLWQCECPAHPGHRPCQPRRHSLLCKTGWILTNHEDDFSQTWSTTSASEFHNPAIIQLYKRKASVPFWELQSIYQAHECKNWTSHMTAFVSTLGIFRSPKKVRPRVLGMDFSQGPGSLWWRPSTDPAWNLGLILIHPQHTSIQVDRPETKIPGDTSATPPGLTWLTLNSNEKQIKSNLDGRDVIPS